MVAQVPDAADPGSRRDIGHVQLDVGRAGGARVKRMIYPAGFHWAADMKPVTGTDPSKSATIRSRPGRTADRAISAISATPTRVALGPLGDRGVKA